MTLHGDDELSWCAFPVEWFEWLNERTRDPVRDLAVLWFLARFTDGEFGDESDDEDDEDTEAIDAEW
jgi:hypothetical protein